MDFLLQQNNLLVLGLVIISGAMLVLGSLRKGQTAEAVSTQDAVRLVNHERGVFVDVRPAEKFGEGTIAQARNLPLDQLDDKAASLPKERPIIVVCDSGQQSGAAAGKLRKLGFEKAVSLKGGLRSWSQDGLPLSKPGK
ncbi:MAG TPA: rhodanese-like domain-containing protein [Burkholderiaceae bacterium]|nr:rhodanese-like domain-containing protein [Burkholderiaceae bacterium]